MQNPLEEPSSPSSDNRADQPSIDDGDVEEAHNTPSPLEGSRETGGVCPGEGGSSQNVMLTPRVRRELTVDGYGDGERGEGSAAVQSGGSGAKRKSDLVDPPSGPPTCSVCNKQYPSWKAVFGHLRSHPERQWRGSFPPPAPSSPLTSRARDLQTGPQCELGGGSARALRFDLNEPMEEGDDGGNLRAEEKDVNVDTGIDLNKLPACDDSDDERN